MSQFNTLLLYIFTAIIEIFACYLPLLWLKHGKSIWLLVPSTLCLALFVWLLTLSPSEAGRTYAAYGGVYVVIAILWLWGVEGIRPTSWDFLGMVTVLIGTIIIACAPRG